MMRTKELHSGGQGGRRQSFQASKKLQFISKEEEIDAPVSAQTWSRCLRKPRERPILDGPPPWRWHSPRFGVL